ncbi:MAG: hydroxymethylpyrimidine/phosphomethylpyrimidine kinase, partial [Variibacter sp.]|nr:hydroxymethylpyrimidine/phosphomethylpyrimidine kinase [Variibacter sp.]
MTAIAVTIAGSDSSGGAGIQADLKTFAALGVYGASVITALTAQNTRGVTSIHDVPPEFVAQQIDSVFSDLAVSAVKIGMLS